MRFWHGWILCGLGMLLAGSAAAIPDNVSVTVTNPLTGQPAVLNLERYNLRATNFTVRIYADATNYTLLTDLPEVASFRGTVAGDTGSFVSAAFHPNGTIWAKVSYGCRWTKDGNYDPYDGTNRQAWRINGSPTVYQPTNAYVYAAMSNMPVTLTGYSSNSYTAIATSTNFGGPPYLNNLHRIPAQRAKLIVDVAKSYFDGYVGASTSLAIAMAEGKVNDLDHVQVRDFGICYQLVSIALRPNIEAPFLSAGNGRLADLANFWSPQRAAAGFDMVAGFIDIGGGVAYAWGDYSLEAATEFYGGVMCHEMGHNWWHADFETYYDYTETNGEWDAMSGSGLGYAVASATRSQQIRRNNKIGYEWVSYKSPVAPWATPDYATTTTGTPVSVDVLLNDRDANSNALSILSYENPSARGGTVTNLGNKLRYTPPTNNFAGYDTFHYYLGDNTGFRSLSQVQVLVRDPNDALIGYWKLDETNGVLATETTGRGAAGRLLGSADFATASTPGISGNALHFDGAGVIDLGGPRYSPLDGDYTVSLWVQPDSTPAGDMIVWGKGYAAGSKWNGLRIGMNAGAIYVEGNVQGELDATAFTAYAPIIPQPETWYHLVAELDRTNQLVHLWVNGTEYTSTYNRRTLPAGEFVVSTYRAKIGAGTDHDRGTHNKWFKGLIDEVRIYSKALSQAEVVSLYAGGGLLPSSGPSPADGEINVALNRKLTWVPGRTNYQHDVFFGTNAAAVSAATTNSTEYKGRFPSTTFTNTTLATNTAYFWRVDEVQGGTNFTTGDVWTFTTAADQLHGDLVLHLPLDANTTIGTKTYDLAGPPFQDGTLYNGTVAITGWISGALNFDGTNRYVETPALNTPTAEATFSCWVRRNGTQSSYAGILFMRGSQASGLDCASNGELRYHWNNSGSSYGYSPGLILPDGEWALAVLHVTTNKTTFYLGRTNGVLASATNVVSLGTETFSANVRVGSDSTGGRNFKGDIDDAMIWKRALSLAEIQQVFSNGLAGIGIDGAPPAPPAGTHTWTGNADDRWTNDANWAALTAPGLTNIARFDSSSAKNLATVLDASTTNAGLDVSGEIRAMGIAPTNDAVLSLGSGGLNITNTFATATLSVPLVFAATQTWNISAGAALVQGDAADTTHTNLTAGRYATINNDGAVTLNGRFNGTGGFFFNGTGTTTINRLNLYSGTTTVNRGTVILNTWAWYGGSVIGSGQLVINTGGVVRTTQPHVFNGGGDNSIRIRGGTLQLGQEAYMNGSVEMTGGRFDGPGEWRMQGDPIFRASTNTAVVAATINQLGASRTFTVEDGAADPDVNLKGGDNGGVNFTKAGVGSLQISAALSHSGNTILSAGSLRMTGLPDLLPSSGSVTSAAGTTLQFDTADQTLRALTGAGNTVLNGSALTIAPTGRVVYGGIISGSPNGVVPLVNDFISTPGGLTVDGTGAFVLTNACTYTGDTLVNAGAFEVQGTGGIAASTNLIVESSGTLVFTNRTGGFSLGAAQRLHGFGTLRGNFVNAGTVSPGYELLRGTLTFSGAYTQQAAGTLFVELGSAASFDRVVVNGPAALAGTLRLALTNGYAPAIGDVFPLLACSNLVGTFSSVQVPTLPLGYVWQMDYLTTGVVARVLADPNQWVVTALSGDASAAEQGLDPGTFLLNRTGPTNAALTVNLALTGSASNGTDYVAIPTNATFAIGQSNLTVTLTPLDDFLTEGNETTLLTVQPGTNYTIGYSNSAAVTLQDNDYPPTVTITNPTSASVDIPTGVGLVLEAMVNDDGTPVPPGATTAQWTQVSGPAAATFGTSNDWNFNTARFPTTGTYVLRLTAYDGNQSAAAQVTVNYGVSGGGGLLSWTNQSVGYVNPAATYVLTNGTNRITTSGGMSIYSGNTTDDFHFVYAQLAGNCEVTTRVVNVPNVAGTLTRAGVMLRESLAAGARSAFVGINGSSQTRFVYRSSPNTGNANVNGSAITLPYWTKLVRTGNVFKAYVSSTGTNWTQLGTSTTIAMSNTIYAGIAAASGLSGTSGIYVFDRMGVSNATAQGNVGPTVNAGSDVGAALPGTAQLAGSASDDGKPNPPAAMSFQWMKADGPGSVTFSNAASTNTSASFDAPGLYTLRLVANDGAIKTFDDMNVGATGVSVRIEATDATAAEPGVNTGTFTITRDGPTTNALTVAFNIGGSASNGTDFATLGTQATINVGQSNVTVIVTPLDDAAIEGREFITLSLASNAAYVVGTPAAAQISLFDDEVSVISVIASDASAGEPANVGQFLFTRVGDTSTATVVDYAISGTASNGGDYALLPGQLTIPAGASNATLAVSPLDDANGEPLETIILTLLATNSTYAAGTTTDVVIAFSDDDNFAAHLRWAGITNATWDVATTPNWFDQDLGLANVVFSNNQLVTFDDSTGVLVNVDIPVAVAPAGITVNTATNTFTLGGAGSINGTGGVIKTGAQLLTLGGASNTYSGPVTVAGGTLRAGSASALGSTAGGTTIAGGTLDVNGMNLGGEVLSIAGSGAGGAGAIVNSGTDQTFAVQYVHLASNASFGGLTRWDVRAGSAPFVNLNGFTLTKAGTNFVSLVNAAVTNSGDIAVDNGILGFEVGTTVAGSGGITVNPNGQLQVGNWGSTLNVRKPVTLAGGTMGTLTGGGATLLQAPVTIATDSTIFAGSGNDLTLTNGVAGPGRIGKTGTGRLILRGLAGNGGGVVVSNGYLQIGDQNLAQGDIAFDANVNTGAYFEIRRAGPYTFTRSVTGFGALGVSSTNGAIFMAGTNTADQFRIGSGTARGTNAVTVLVAGSSNVVRQVRVADTSLGVGSYGRLEIQPGAYLRAEDFNIGNDSGGFGDVIQYGGTVSITGSTYALRLGHWNGGTNFNTYTMAGGNLSLAAAYLNVGWDGIGLLLQTGGTISTPGLRVDANGTTPALNGTNETYSLEGGTLNLGANGIVSVGGAGGYQINLGGGTIGALTNWSTTLALTLSGTNGQTTFDTAAQTVTLGGTLSGTGGLVKTGTGSLVLHATNTFSGLTTVANGTLTLNGTLSGPVFVTNATLAGTGVIGGAVTSAGVVAPAGSAQGVLTISNQFTTGPGSTLAIQLGGVSTYDRLNVAGTAMLGGALQLALTNSYIPATGASFTVLSAGAITGTFATTNLPTLPVHRRWMVTYGATDVTVSVVFANVAPLILLPGPHIVPVGSATNFAVSAIDAEGDTFTLTNDVAPPGGTFVTGTFAWVAGAALAGSAQPLRFVATDSFGGITTNETELIVPLDANGNGVPDGWEWTTFSTLTNAGTADHDGDGQNMQDEYLAGTNPTNGASVFRAQTIAGSPAQVSVLTVSGRLYRIWFADDALHPVWTPFGNQTNGIGTWLETNGSSGMHGFIDDHSPATSGAAPTNGLRVYRFDVRLLQ